MSPSNEYSGLVSFRIDWIELLAVQGTLNQVFSINKMIMPICCVTKNSLLGEKEGRKEKTKRHVICHRYAFC